MYAQPSNGVDNNSIIRELAHGFNRHWH